ncbi:MAG: Ig-like domain-containing protein, partial [Bacteroidota bacterium]
MESYGQISVCPAADCYATCGANLPDKDGDGVPDGYDLDDDNDGILDIQECLFPAIASTDATALSWVDGSTVVFATGGNMNGDGEEESGWEAYAQSQGYNVTENISWTESGGVISSNTVNGLSYTVELSSATGVTGGVNLTIGDNDQASNDGDNTSVETNNTNQVLNGEEYRLTITPSQPLIGFSFDFNDIFDFGGETTLLEYNISFATTCGGTLTEVASIADETFAGGSATADINIESSDNTIQGQVGAGDNVETTVGFITTTPFQCIVIDYKYVEMPAGQQAGGGQEFQGIDNFNAIIADDFLCDEDMDGVPNNLDLDADNDGIPDANEACGAATATTMLTGNCTLDDSGGFDTDGAGCSTGVISGSGCGGSSSCTGAATIESSDGAVNPTNAADGDNTTEAELNSTGDEIIFDLGFVPSSPLTATLDYNIESGTAPIWVVESSSMPASGFTAVAESPVNLSQGGTLGNGDSGMLDITVPSGSRYIRVVSDNGANADLDDLIFSCPGSLANTDNAGAPDFLDLDSDGDGCPDAQEAGTAASANTTAFTVTDVDDCGLVLSDPTDNSSGICGTPPNDDWIDNTVCNDIETLAEPDINQTPEDVPVSGNLLTNDEDPQGDAQMVTSITLPDGTVVPVPASGTTGAINLPGGEGTIEVAADGSYTYTPASGFTGNVPTIDYTITDNTGATDTTTLDIDVIPADDPTVDEPPVANDDTNVTDQDVDVTGNVIDPNDSDPDTPQDDLVVTSILADTDGDGMVDDPVTVGTPTTVFGTDEDGNTVTAGEITLNADGSYT